MRYAKLDDTTIEQILAKAKNDLKKLVNKNSITINLNPELKANISVLFTPTAWIKMQLLVSKTDDEIAWHCVVDRQDPTTFIISDILLYPQTVTGVTVTTDDTEYNKWLMGHPDEIFFRLRGHGHSHVNMGTNPSGTDDNLQNGILTNLKDNDYYIFFIINKKGEMWVNVYDFMSNMIYETKDIDVDILTNDISLTTWITTEKQKFFTKQTYNTPVAFTPGFSNYRVDKDGFSVYEDPRDIMRY